MTLKEDIKACPEESRRKATRREFLKKAALTTGGIAVSLMACELDMNPEELPDNEASEIPDSEEASPRTIQITLAHEAMLSGILMNRAILPQVMLKSGSYDIMNQVAIDLWMGASPVYTNRMRTLMGIEGDNVAAIMKALQLDVGFVHQYMDVAYAVQDDFYGEFWLNHCGALLDTEPAGEDRVFDMCHTIEDPTFDATALATNPQARIRHIHRPPREPADRVPHCHWTITIDPLNEPLDPAILTGQVSELPLAGVPNSPPAEPSPDGRTNYAGDFDPAFKLSSFSTGTLYAVQKEFTVQTHLLAAAAELSLAMQFDQNTAHRIMARAWAGVSWMTSERLATALGLDDNPGAEGIAAVLAEQPLLPPGFSRDITVESDNAVRITLETEVQGLLDPDHPGIPGMMARGVQRGWRAMAQAVDPRARLTGLTIDDNRITAVFNLWPRFLPAPKPVMTALINSIASNWIFTFENS